ncbi:MAG: hypothetical protein M1821_004369 [Bathelium mastoideum]|nr:MAG: hypothetical protein M1821_004369 [Bathelium mastoideum]
MDEDWTASHFSPSKARQQRAQAKDWEYVQSWLEKKFAPRPVPNYERNEETLKAFLELATFNDAADEELNLIDSVHDAALDELQTQVRNFKDDHSIMQSVIEAMPSEGQRSLNALSELATVLNAPNSKPSTYVARLDEDNSYLKRCRLAKQVLDLTAAEISVQQQRQRANAIVSYLEAELIHLNKIRTTLESEKFAGAPELGQKTTDWSRSTKQLRSKVIEYNDRCRSLTEATSIQPSATELKQMELSLADVKYRLRSLESDVREFEGLPHDVDLARFRVAEVHQELQDLRRRRDLQFEGLVER